MLTVVLTLSAAFVAIIVAVLGNWLIPPAWPKRKIAIVFGIAALVSLGLTGYTSIRNGGQQGDGGSGNRKESVETPGLAPTSIQPATPTSTSPGPQTTAESGTVGGQQRTTSRQGPNTQPPADGVPPPTEPTFVAASGFTEFGASHASFLLSPRGTQLTIATPDTYYELGGWLPGNARCTATVSFDVWADQATADSVAGYGFGVSPRGSVSNDDPLGSAVLFEPSVTSQGQPDFSTWLVAIDELPRHSKGMDWVEGPDLRSKRRITVAASGSTFIVYIDDRPFRTFSTVAQCGDLQFFAWGGLTVHFDHIQLT